MPNAAAGETIIAQGVKVEGDFHSNGDVVIDGEVSGSVETAKSLRIGETARIKADVHAQNAVISGLVEGNLVVDQMLELLSTSKVDGDITTGRISVAAGAQINGKLSMGAVSEPEEDEASEEE
ncbi:MAG: polymer-forming cytoskeletal protein [Parcubacteria group bacterium]|nr:polymer-forming cytoskeletal protein [Parcubacteria group bacterium]